MPTGNIIRIKRSTAQNSVPTTAALVNAELAFNEYDEILYYGKGGNGSASDSIITIGGKGAYVTLGDVQTITGTKTIATTALKITKTNAINNQVLTLTNAANGTVDWTTVSSNSFTNINVNSTTISADTASDTLSLTSTGLVTLTPDTNNDSIAFGVRSATTLVTGVVQLNGELDVVLAGGERGIDTQAATQRVVQQVWEKLVGTGVGVGGTVNVRTAAPTIDEHAATKRYVDDQIKDKIAQNLQGLDIKASVKVATTTDLNADYTHGSGNGVGATLKAKGLEGAIAIDGITLALTDRVLVKNQTNASENGIYTVTTVGTAAVNWVLTRATDFDYSEPTNPKVTSGSFTFVEQGTANADTGWVLTTDTITLGTTGLTFTQFSGAGAITAGSGLTQSGTTINVASTGGGSLVIGADSINLASSGVAAGTYRSVTTDIYGRVTAGANPTTLSGYEITDALSNSTTSTQNGYFGDIFLYDDTTPSHYLQITNSANLTAARTLSINVNDVNRTVSLSGNLTVSSTATISGTNTGDQAIALTGDVTGTWGTGTIPTTLANSGVAAGTYNTVTVDVKGRVTAGTNDALSKTTTTSQAVSSRIIFAPINATSTVGSVAFVDTSLDPSSPEAGDLWNNAGALKFRVSNILGTKTIAFTDSAMTGTWNGTTIPVNKGGTGLTSISPGVLVANTANTISSAAALSVNYGGTGLSSLPSGIFKSTTGSDLIAATAGSDYMKGDTLTVGTIITAAATETVTGSIRLTNSSADPLMGNTAGDIWRVGDTIKYFGAAKKTFAFTDSTMVAGATWNGNAVGVAYGGTGVTSFIDKGIFYANGTNAVGFVSGSWDSANSVGSLLSVNSSGAPTFTNTINGGTY